MEDGRVRAESAEQTGLLREGRADVAGVTDRGIVYVTGPRL